MCAFIIFATVVILLFGLFEVLLLRLLNRVWWESGIIRRCAYGLPLVGALMVLFWGAGIYYSISWVTLGAAALVTFTLVLEIALMLSLPISGLIHMIGRLIEYCVRRHRADRSGREVDQRRRLLLKAAAAAVPAMSIGMTGQGIQARRSDSRSAGGSRRIEDPAPFRFTPGALCNSR
jgi:hypothetical protein